MKKRKSKKRDKAFLDELLKKSKRVSIPESGGSLIENMIDTILLERGEDPTAIDKLKSELMKEFVDWNEIRLVSPDRLEGFFEKLGNGDYKRKVVQALLNKIFSRSGSLDFQFLLDFETDDLEDYLSGIMEMSEETRKLLLVRVFKKNILPISTEHEVIFEMVGTTYSPGDEQMKETFSQLDPEELEGIKNLLDIVLNEQGRMDYENVEDVKVKSKTLNAILKSIDI